jgi:hypothetical protein
MAVRRRRGADHRDVTFALDVETISRLADAAGRLRKSKSAVVREAIHDYHERIGRLSEGERTRLLRILDTRLPQVPGRPQSAVQRELDEIRAARKAGGRKSRSERR